MRDTVALQDALEAAERRCDDLARREQRYVEAQRISKLGQGRPDVLDAVKNGEIHLIVNTPVGKGAHTDEGRIRQEALGKRIPIITTLSGAAAAVNGIAAQRQQAVQVQSLQEYHARRLVPVS